MSVYQCYSTQMTLDEKERSLQLLDTFHRLSERHQLDYAACYGTALGHVRHGGFIPWDDDVDVCVPAEQADRLARVLGDMPAWTGYAYHPEDFHKVFDKSGADAGLPWRWPFLDVFEVPKDDPHHPHLFPGRTPEQLFEGRLPLRLPHDAAAHLALQYGERYMEQLLDGGYSHRLEKDVRDCEPLAASLDGLGHQRAGRVHPLLAGNHDAGQQTCTLGAGDVAQRQRSGAGHVNMGVRTAVLQRLGVLHPPVAGGAVEEPGHAHS